MTPSSKDPEPRHPGPPSRAARPSAYPESVTRLIDEFARLPGIGRRSAERLAFHVLKSARTDILPLAQAVRDVKDRVRHCRVCYNLSDSGASAADSPTAPGGSLCAICSDESRDRSIVMVVEQPKDLIALERTGAFKGIYHVLMGHISPLEGVGPGDVTLADLVARVATPAANAGGVPVREVILAMNPNLEGDGTSLYLVQALGEASAKSAPGVRITRLARGVPTGTQLEYASQAVLADAIQGRR